jgi:FkbM family methyltransferase
MHSSDLHFGDLCFQLGPIAYNRALSAWLAAYYAGPDHPMKLRLLRSFERLIGRRRILRPTKAGFLMALDQQELIQRRIFYERIWEQEITALLADELRPDDVVYDIGANVGYYTCLAATVGVCNVVSVEPDPSVCAILQFNIHVNHFKNVVSVHRAAVTDEVGTAVFHRASDSGVSGLGAWDARNTTKSFNVDTINLDAMVQQRRYPAPTVLKIDVEGWEANVLAGGKWLFTTAPPRLVVFETNSEPAGQVENTWIKNFLLNNGYAISHIRRADGSIECVENFVARLHRSHGAD